MAFLTRLTSSRLVVRWTKLLQRRSMLHRSPGGEDEALSSVGESTRNVAVAVKSAVSMKVCHTMASRDQS